MERLRGRLVRWEAPRNKRDAADYWGHTGALTLQVSEDTELVVKNAVGGVILRPTDGVSEAMLEEYLGAEVEVEGEFDHGRVVAESKEETDASVKGADGLAENTDISVKYAANSEKEEMGTLVKEGADDSVVSLDGESLGMEAMPMRSMGLGPEQMAQTLMIPHRLGEDGRVAYQPAPRYEGVGFRVWAVRRG